MPRKDVTQPSIDEQLATLEAQLTTANTEYREAVARAAADPKLVTQLPPLRQRVVDVEGAIADLQLVLEEVQRAKERARAEEEARLADEKWVAGALTALRHVDKFQAAGAELQRAIEGLGSAYKAFIAVRSAANNALYHVDLTGRVASDIDRAVANNLMVKAELKHLPGFDEHPRIWEFPDPIDESVRNICRLLREELIGQGEARGARAQEALVKLRAAQEQAATVEEAGVLT